MICTKKGESGREGDDKHKWTPRLWTPHRVSSRIVLLLPHSSASHTVGPRIEGQIRVWGICRAIIKIFSYDFVWLKYCIQAPNSSKFLVSNHLEPFLKSIPKPSRVLCAYSSIPCITTWGSISQMERPQAFCGYGDVIFWLPASSGHCYCGTAKKYVSMTSHQVQWLSLDLSLLMAFPLAEAPECFGAHSHCITIS